jgi:hypothetical protein
MILQTPYFTKKLIEMSKRIITIPITIGQAREHLKRTAQYAKSLVLKRFMKLFLQSRAYLKASTVVPTVVLHCRCRS